MRVYEIFSSKVANKVRLKDLIGYNPTTLLCKSNTQIHKRNGNLVSGE
jgi:hypothetical protein